MHVLRILRLKHATEKKPVFLSINSNFAYLLVVGYFSRSICAMRRAETQFFVTASIRSRVSWQGNGKNVIATMYLHQST